MNQQDVQNQLLGLANAYRDSNGAVDWNAMQQAATAWAHQNNVDPALLAQAANQINPNMGWDVNKIQQAMAQFGPKSTDYGLGAATNSINQGAADATQRIGATQTLVGNLFNQGQAQLQPWQTQGLQAGQLQAALSGALGADAQKQAFANYQASPGVQFALDQGNKNILRNAAATGGLGGGNVQKALEQYGIGVAQQDYQNQFNNLGTLANQGYGAATTGAGLSASQAGIQSNLGQASAQIPMWQAGQNSQNQMQTGRDMSTNLSGMTSALATLQNQQGAGNADIYGNTSTNLANLYQQATQGNTQAIQQLAQLLQNTNMNASGQYAGQPNTGYYPTNNTQQLSQFTGSLSGLLQGIKPQTMGQTGVNSSYNTNPGYGPSYTAPYNPNSLLSGNYNPLNTSGLSNL